MKPLNIQTKIALAIATILMLIAGFWLNILWYRLMHHLAL